MLFTSFVRKINILSERQNYLLYIYSYDISL